MSTWHKHSWGELTLLHNPTQPTHIVYVHWSTKPLDISGRPINLWLCRSHLTPPPSPRPLPTRLQRKSRCSSVDQLAWSMVQTACPHGHHSLRYRKFSSSLSCCRLRLVRLVSSVSDLRPTQPGLIQQPQKPDYIWCNLATGTINSALRQLWLIQWPQMQDNLATGTINSVLRLTTNITVTKICLHPTKPGNWHDKFSVETDHNCHKNLTTADVIWKLVW